MQKPGGEGPMQFWYLSSPISIFLNEQFYATNRYIHVTQKVEEDILFVLA